MLSPELNSNQLWRLVDASLNRMAEGLRYLEDVCRFVLNDIALNQRLKNIRHEMVVGDSASHKQLIEARDATSDVGTNLEADTDKESSRDLLSSVVANSSRVQEALRSLEETSKILHLAPNLTYKKIQRSRFDVYTIQKEMVGKLTRQEKTQRMHGLYVVIDTQALKGRSHIWVTRQVIEGGAKIIQLRDKSTERGQILSIAYEMNELCHQNDVLFIVNDYVDIALAVKADGVHLGQSDIPVTVARKILPIDMLIGCSVTNVRMAKQAQEDGADYVAVSGIYPTINKEDVQPLGTALIKRVKRSVSLPLVAIGGIKLENIKELKNLGVDAVAVISAVLGARSPKVAARQMCKKIEEN